MAMTAEQESMVNEVLVRGTPKLLGAMDDLTFNEFMVCLIAAMKSNVTDPRFSVMAIIIEKLLMSI